MAFVASGGVVSRRGVRAVNIRRNAGKADGEKVNVGKTPVQDGSSVGDGRDGPVDFNALRAKVEQRVKDEGVPLDVLMNPAKVLDLEARLELEADSLTEEEREKLKATLIKEKRMVMQDWLRNVFLVQGWGSAAIGGIMASGHVPFVPDVPLGARVLGFWLIWLFTIPALRARKPAKWEKSALNFAFLGIILANVITPFFTKEPLTLWTIDMAIMGICYGYSYNASSKDGDAIASPKIKGALRWFDWGSWK
uniref:Uncharacterized protein n=4 Tax=Rhodosorus marinus TaxID=101924 RepID=A0A7S3EKL0_9RHOD|mmetsp:Transcript_40229/g.159842  ORF Transcript_40229/g.159842 Transcript_40229/m.159842 type:complete len:251 (+) Transcript_40229:434-1186(+)